MTRWANRVPRSRSSLHRSLWMAPPRASTEPVQGVAREIRAVCALAHERRPKVGFYADLVFTASGTGPYSHPAIFTAWRCDGQHFPTNSRSSADHSSERICAAGRLRGGVDNSATVRDGAFGKPSPNTLRFRHPPRDRVCEAARRPLQQRLCCLDVAATSAIVAGTRSRLAKVAALADLLRRLDPAEAPIAVGLLTGEPRQGRIGVGWATALRADVAPAAQPSLTLIDVDRRLTELQTTTGPGSTSGGSACSPTC